MNKIPIPNFSEDKISKNSSFRKGALKKIISHLILNFNENIDAYEIFVSNEKLRRTMAKSIVFNFILIENLLKTVDSKFNIEEMKELRDCIAHNDERIKKFYNSEKGINEGKYHTKNVINNGNFGGIQGVSANGANYKYENGKVTVYSPFGIINNQDLVGLNDQGDTILISLNEDIFNSYRNEIEKVINKYTD